MHRRRARPRQRSHAVILGLWALTVPQPKFRRLLAGAGAVSRRSSFSGATERDTAAGTRCPPPPGCQIRPGQEHQSRGGSPAPLLYLLLALNPLCRHSPPAHSPGAEGAAGFGPPPVIFRGRQEGFAMWPVLGRGWSASCLEKNPTSFRKCFLRPQPGTPRATPARHRVFTAFTTSPGN